uniref:Uncharacterized protein n=1 Tax=Romanomermis culicivorax TaxID=13658 RepID=A0A915KN34_ROMCU
MLKRTKRIKEQQNKRKNKEKEKEMREETRIEKTWKKRILHPPIRHKYRQKKSGYLFANNYRIRGLDLFGHRHLHVDSAD